MHKHLSVMILFERLARLSTRTLYLAVVLSYLPPVLWYALTGQGMYQDVFHLLIVLLASGVATGKEVTSTRLHVFLKASMFLNLLLLAGVVLGWVHSVLWVFTALLLLMLSVVYYYVWWAYSYWRSKHNSLNRK